MPKPAPPLQRDVASRLRAGVERLLGEGQTFAELQIDALCKESGVAKSTFYVHFKDKNELLRALAAGVMQELVDFDEAWWATPVDATKPQLREGIERTYRVYAAHGPLMAAIVEATIYDSEMREQFGRMMGGAVDATAQYLRSGQRACAISEDLDAKRTAHWLTWMLERGFIRLLRERSDRAGERSLDALTDIVWCTIRGRPA